MSVKIIRKDGVLRNGKTLPEGTVVENPSKEERKRWLHFKEAEEMAAAQPPPPPPPGGNKGGDKK